MGFVEVIIHFRLDKVSYIFIYAYTTRRHGRRTEFGFCLSLELGFFHVNGNGGNDTVTDIGVLLVLL